MHYKVGSIIALEPDRLKYKDRSSVKQIPEKFEVTVVGQLHIGHPSECYEHVLVAEYKGNSERVKPHFGPNLTFLAKIFDLELVDIESFEERSRWRNHVNKMARMEAFAYDRFDSVELEGVSKFHGFTVCLKDDRLVHILIFDYSGRLAAPFQRQGTPLHLGLRRE